MSYLALARKWRPNQFNQVVGQSHVLTALENALNQNKLHHAYLFSGTRGVGKTTIGRLLSKGLNCETGITATPCGHCATCREIEEGRFVDLLEIDAASRTKVEDTRELLDNVQYKPARGRFKVYLIDEVHMLSRHSFNALLKTLEEPPEYVKFLLATTDPQKLPVTILSRCLQFHLKPISVDHIHQQLDHILQQEQVSAEQRALGMIAHAADGSMRDALSLADQAIALGNGSVVTDTVSSMLGTLDADQAIHLLEAIASKQTQSAMHAIEHLAQNGVEWDGLLQELASQLHRIAMYQALPSSLDKSKPDAEKIELLSQYLSPQDVQLYYQIALKGREDLPLSPAPKMGLEMTVLRMMAFRPEKVDIVTAIRIPKAEEQEQLILPPEPRLQEQTPAAAPQQAMPPSARVENIESSTPTHAYDNAASTEPVAVPEEPVGKQSQPSELPPLPSEDDYPPVPISEEYEAEFVLPSSVMSENPEPEYAQQPTPRSAKANVQQQPTLSQSPVQSSTQVATRPTGGLRHQLRSRRMQASSEQPTAGNGGKKSEAASKSVLERVAEQHSVAKTVSQPQSEGVEQIDSVEKKPKDDATSYQWKPMSEPEESLETSKELSPTKLKQALEHTKTPEMVVKLQNESVAQDEWAALIQKLTIPKLVEQLALNSSFEKQDTTIALTLRATQAHLNTDKAQSELLSALNHVLAEQCHLSIEIGEKGRTPLELREAIYQNKLEMAHNALANDPNVQFIQTRFAAELDSDSVRPI